MTINSETRVAGPFDGNDSTVSFPFTFKVFDSDEVRVVAETGAVETDLELGTDYTVALNADQNASPGGSVVLVYPLPTGTRLTLTSALEMLQPVDLTNQGGFYPRVINSALDRLTILLQQLASVVSRTLKFPLSDGPVGDLPGRSVRAGTVLAFDEATGEPVAGPDISSVNGVAGALVAVNTVADNIVDVNTVADNIVDVNTVGQSIANVNTVAGNTANVNTVAGNIADVNMVADNIVDVSNFSGVYYGASSSDPTTRRDGSPLQSGDLYFNTVTDAMRTFNGTAWRESVSGAVTVQNFSGDGAETEFLLDYAPESEVITSVFVSGVYQQKNTYELGGANGDVLIFSTPPAAGASNIEVVVSSLVPSDDQLRQDLAAPGGADLIGYLSGTVADALSGVSISVKAYGAVGDGVTDDTAAIQACLNDAAAQRASVVGSPLDVYSVSTLNVPSGVRRVDFTEGTIKGRGTAPVAVVTLGTAEAPLAAHSVVSLRMDMSAGDRVAIKGNNTSDCIIERCRIFGFTDHATLNHYGILLEGTCSRNVIRANNIVGFNNPVQRGLLIDLLADGQADYGGFYTGTITRATGPCVGNIISDNVLTYGSYAVNLLGCERSIVKGNYCHQQNHRSIYVANASWENIISDNVLSEYKSSGVLLGYGAGRNSVTNNILKRVIYDAGEAAINVNTGAQYNLIDGNKIFSGANYGVYMACDVVGNIVQNNDIQNHYLAAIMLENDWKNPRPTLSPFSRPNYGAPEGSAWSHVNSSDNVIKGNIIRAGYAGRSTAAVALAQIDALGGTSLTNNRVSDNHVLTAANVGNNLHMYADTPAKFSGTVITNNTFHPTPQFTNASDGVVSAPWAPAIGFFSANRGLDYILRSEPIPLTIGTTTPAIATNGAYGTDRVFSLANTSAISITGFTGAPNGMEITVRLDAFSTLVHNNAVMRLKGGTNVAPTSTNNFIRLRRESGVWFEVGRSF